MKKRLNRLIPALLAAVVLTALFFPAGAQAQRREKFRMLARDVLDLTPEQEKALDDLRKVREERGQAFRDEMRKMRGELQDLLRAPSGDEKKIEGLIDEMFRLRSGRLKGVLRHRKDVEKILTPEQLEKLKKYRAEFSGRDRLAGGDRWRSAGISRWRSRRDFRHFRGLGLGARTPGWDR